MKMAKTKKNHNSSQQKQRCIENLLSALIYLLFFLLSLCLGFRIGFETVEYSC